MNVVPTAVPSPGKKLSCVFWSSTINARPNAVDKSAKNPVISRAVLCFVLMACRLLSGMNMLSVEW